MESSSNATRSKAFPSTGVSSICTSNSYYVAKGTYQCPLKQLIDRCTRTPYLPITGVENGTITAAHNQSTAIGYWMGNSNRFYFKWPSCESPFSSKHLQSRRDKNSKFFQTLLYELFKYRRLSLSRLNLNYITENTHYLTVKLFWKEACSSKIIKT